MGKKRLAYIVAAPLMYVFYNISITAFWRLAAFAKSDEQKINPMPKYQLASWPALVCAAGIAARQRK